MVRRERKRSIIIVIRFERHLDSDVPTIFYNQLVPIILFESIATKAYDIRFIFWKRRRKVSKEDKGHRRVFFFPLGM